MRAIMLMFDTLNRHMLPNYGCDWTKLPNFARLSERMVTFDNAYIGSMPCMPARREIHTGRHNFLHRSWGPLEPFDDSMPQLLCDNGVNAHLFTDHYHYWEDGAGTYHNRYQTYEFFRGHEGDKWIGDNRRLEMPEALHSRYVNHWGDQDWINRQYMTEERQQPMPKTFAAGIDFLKRNATCQDWFVQIETFDPHEPFFTQQHWKDLYPHDYDGPLFDWPPYGPVDSDVTDRKAIEHCRFEYAALLSMCDHYLGRVIDLMDSLAMWDDTMLIINTDHGFLLGEHDMWAKCWCPFYQEHAHIPLWIWDPRSKVAGERRQSLVQTIDLPATLLDFFQVELPADMQGRPLGQTIIDDSPVREAALFGIHGGHVTVTDGRYVYMRGHARPDNQPLYEYTLMPTHMRHPFRPQEFTGTELHEGFSFTKGCPVMRIPTRRTNPCDTMLWDLQADYGQTMPVQDAGIEARMTEQLVALMRWNEAPPEQFERLGVA